MKKTYNILFKILLFVFTLQLVLTSITFAQTQRYFKTLHFENLNKKRIHIPFELIHNLIIIPLKINNSETLKFIMDTGVSYTLLTDLTGTDGIALNYLRTIKLYGHGEGDAVEAYHSVGNTIRMNQIIGRNQDILIPKDNIFHLAKTLGVQVHGLIGYDLFKSFVVEINYRKRELVLHNPQRYRKKRRYASIPILIENKKPFIRASLRTSNDKEVPVKLLVDSGASHALSLFHESDSNINVPEKSFRTYIGLGLNGDIFGNIGRLQGFQLGAYTFNQPIVAYPDESSMKASMTENQRNGSLGAELLKRFTVIFDYPARQMYLRPNADFKKPFKYNMSGIEVTTPIPGLPAYVISKVRDNSPALEAGLLSGDQIISINGITASKYSLNEIIELFQSKEGRKIQLTIQRDTIKRQAKFTLRDPI
ncbi:PDZ domain-containing protein [Rapidithrix thailandica]|uniref:PDZ domain-containing protein n=1 Tax=Rapidithrix thailandica TaxID=413964 RepID=A0AAW9S328_9BACT